MSETTAAPPELPVTDRVLPDPAPAVTAVPSGRQHGLHLGVPADPDLPPLERPRTARRLAATWTDGFGTLAMRCLQALIVAAAAAALIVLAARLNTVVIPLVISLILASALSPLTRWLEVHGWPRALAALSTLVLGLVLLAGVTAGIVIAVIAQWASLVAAASTGVDRLVRSLASSGLPIDQAQFENARRNAVAFFTNGSFASTALAGLSTVTSLVTGLVLMLFVLFFFLKDGALIWRFLLQPFHGEARARGDRIGDRAVTVLGGYVRGTTLVALFDAVFIGLGLVILRVPLAIPLAVLMFATAYIPVIGSILAGAVAALVSFVTGGPVQAVIVIAIVIAVNQFEGNVLQPVVMGRTVSLHPLMILLVLTAGTVLAGIVGALLAVPITSVVWAAIKGWRAPEPALTAPPLEPTG
ncbi:MAG TPA: AI-2E family transporter [Amnibacterium sp.]|uniref:AI-2E family transporter n=1 Tax=Amnibacterium sp. TaxID=1872496 RepID=UPI002F92F7EE